MNIGTLRKEKYLIEIQASTYPAMFQSSCVSGFHLFIKCWYKPYCLL